jgi:2-C-methyl-D-erythritol 2,4-cyclodiphosphate synthase
MQNCRIGTGFDVHRLVENRKLILGGVEIPFEKGLLGHSDADVLLHALCDALLGAVALRDIGYHFPPSDERFKDIDSKILLSKTLDLIVGKGYFVNNADLTICAERPKLLRFIPDMQKIIAEILKVSADVISVKATTTERLGFVGREEGMCAMATVLVCRE